MQDTLRLLALFAVAVAVVPAIACSSSNNNDGGGPADTGPTGQDAGPKDSGASPDAGMKPTDGGSPIDSGGPTDSGGPLDAGASDSGAPDAGSILKAHCDAPVTVDTASRIANFPKAGSNGHGVAAVSWQDIDPTGARVPKGEVAIFANGAFGTPHVLNDAVYRSAELAVDGSGNVHARWEDAAEMSRPRADYDAASQTWTAGNWISGVGADLATSFQNLVVNQGGVALQAIWYDGQGGRQATAGSWDPAMKLWSPLFSLQAESSTSIPNNPRVAINALGKGAAIWFSRDANDTMTTLHGRTFTLQAGFSGDSTVAVDHLQIPEVVVAMSPSGDAIAMYTTPSSLAARTFSASGRWGAPVTIAADIVSALNAIADDDGDITLVWSGSAGMIMAARNLGAGWSQPVMLGQGGSPGFAIDSDSTVSLILTFQNGAILRRIAKRGETWTDPVTASDGDPAQLVDKALVAHDSANNPIVMYAAVTTSTTGNMVHIHARICR